MISKLIILACLLAASYAHIQARQITGDHDAKPGKFPYQVFLQVISYDLINGTYYDYLCSGSIINETWILTSGRCSTQVKERMSNDVTVVVKAGKHVIDVFEQSEQTAYIHGSYPHEFFYSHLDKPEYDIGLIKLENSLDLNDWVAVINLPVQDTEPTGNATMSGWGTKTTEPMFCENIYRISRTLQNMTLPIIEQSKCNDLIKKISIGDELPGDLWDSFGDLVHERSICTADFESTIADAHQGNSGDPLVTKNNNGKPELVGLTSWESFPCRVIGSPTVYTKVSSFTDWIIRHSGIRR